jgi:arylsulfatase A-like enzyme
LHLRFAPSSPSTIDPQAAATATATPQKGRIHPLELFPLAILLGLLTGPAEFLGLYTRRHLLDPSAISAVELNRHVLWMLPFSTTLLSASLGLLLAALAFLVRKRHFTGLCLCGILFLAVYDLMILYRGLSSIACCTLSAGIAFNLTAPLVNLIARYRRTLYALTALLLTSLTAAVAVDFLRDELTSTPTASARPGSPNLLFIVLDTVRAQSLGLYGNTAGNSPNLDRLASRAQVFTNARAAAPWTLPSHATMFTGHWPSELSTRLDNPLDSTFPTLAEFLRDNGYATAGFVANSFFCSRWYGLNRGFLHYEDVRWTTREIISASNAGRAITRKFFPALHDRPTAYFERKDAPTINAEFTTWLTSRPKSHPFFAFLNYYDAHDPYVTPPNARTSKPEPQGEEFEKVRDWHRIKKSDLSAADIAHAREAYEDCVTYLDEQIGTLIKTLELRGNLKNTYIIITADHGEEFQEHGDFGHGNNLYNPAIHVPLLILPPTRLVQTSTTTINAPVSLRDLPATVVDLLGLTQNSPFPGRSLAKLAHQPITPPSAGAAPVVLSEIVDQDGLEIKQPRLTRALATGPYVYIRHHDAREELFNTANDPKQAQDLLNNPAHAQPLAQFRHAMTEIDTNHPAPALDKPPHRPTMIIPSGIHPED